MPPATIVVLLGKKFQVSGFRFCRFAPIAHIHNNQISVVCFADERVNIPILNFIYGIKNTYKYVVPSQN